MRVPSPSSFLVCFLVVRWIVRSRDFDRLLYLVGKVYEYENELYVDELHFFWQYFHLIPSLYEDFMSI